MYFVLYFGYTPKHLMSSTNITENNRISIVILKRKKRKIENRSFLFQTSVPACELKKAGNFEQKDR